MEEVLQWLTLNLDKLFLWLSGTTIGGFTLFKIGSIVVSLIKNKGYKKYLAKINQIKNEIDVELRELKEYQKQVAREEAEIVANKVIESFNRLQDKTFEKKQEIYNNIFNKQMEAKEITESFVEEIKPEIEPNSSESEIVEEIITETPIVEIQSEIENETPKKKVDLL